MEGEKNHQRLWTLRNKLRALEGCGVGGWVSLVMGIKEGMYCMEHWVWCKNKTVTLKRNKNNVKIKRS